MKRLLFALVLIGIGHAGMAQVQDNAVIPLSVTVNSVLRLQVNSGGNIQFVFNTMSQFTGGIPNTANTDTKFTVSSSRGFTVDIVAEDGNLIGITSGQTADLSLIQYVVEGPHTATVQTTPLIQNPTNPLVNSDDPVNGEIHTIHWEAGTPGGSPATGLAPDTYVTNILLTLKPKN